MTDYVTKISYDCSDPQWDSFVALTPGGHHVQTTFWAQVKAIAGHRVVRLVSADQHNIVGGAQMLMRTVPALGTMGYVTKAPLCASDDPCLLEQVVEGLLSLGRKHHLRYLVIQPPNDGECIAAQLTLMGFRRSSLELASAATVTLDLNSGLEDIWRQMKRQNRQNIRRSEHDGLVVREGTETDVRTFYRLHLATSQRQEFTPYSERYYEGMWRLLDPPGYIKLLLAEYQGEPVSALLLVPFADTVIAKKLGWTGLHSNHRPNHLLFWESIKWAKAHGYRCFDFEGIDPDGAKAIVEGKPLPESLYRTWTFFKLNFGGKVVLYPGSYDYVYNPLVRRALGKIDPDLGLGSSYCQGS